jgi:ATP-dependent DNA ligase
MSNIIEIKGIEYSIFEQSDAIMSPSKKGTKYWQGYILHKVDGYIGHSFYTATASWSTTKDGFSKKNWSIPYYAEPKNIGKANETSNAKQAKLEFDSMVKKEQDKRLADRPMPMLAQSYDKHAKKIVFPCYVQPKFDGMRMLYDGTTAWSRGNKDIIPEVVQHLHFDTRGCVIDGELILPNNPKVNEVMKAAKKYRPGVSDQLVYRVYDIVDDTLSFNERITKLFDIVLSATTSGIFVASTVMVANEDELRYWHDYHVQEGYEGTMVRNASGLYTIGQRSYDLQKFKDFIDEEFLIIDIVPSGGGAASEVGKAVCVTDEGNQFESTFTGDEDYRRWILENKHKVIGKFAKIKYRERSGATNVPFHSNVLEIRETKNAGY